MGFVELQPPPPPPPLAPPEPALSRTEQATLALQQREEERWEEHRRAVLESIPAIPTDISERLGLDGVQALWQYQMDQLHSIRDADEWCSVVLPGLAVSLLADAVEHAESQASREHLHRLELQAMHNSQLQVAFVDATDQDRAARRARAEQHDEEMDEKDDQIEELQKQLAVAEGKVQLMQGLLSEQLGGSRAD